MLKQFNFPSSLAAGNVTVTNLSFTLDYSNKTNPAVQLTMPLDGMKISGGSFTLRGQVDDPTVTVTASITDTNGDVSVVNGEVERNGRFWVEDLPLNSGTNTLSIMVSNVVGQATVTNLNLVQSALTLTMTPVSDPSQLWQPTVSVGGSVSDPSYAVWVNGVQGTNIGGTWSADNVPVTPGGVAVFDVTAYPPGEAPAGSFSGESVVNPQTANAANSITNNADKPARLYLQSYQMTVNSMAHEEDDGSGNYYTSTLYYHMDWNATNGGGDKWLETMDQGGSWTEEGFWKQTDQWPVSGTGIYKYDSTNVINGQTNEYSETDGDDPPPTLPSDLNPNEHMIIKGHSDVTQSGDSYTYHGHAEDNETADAQWTLETGGKGLPGLSVPQAVFQFSAGAESYKEVSVTPAYDWPVAVDIRDAGPVPPSQIKVNGKALGSDGIMYQVLSDNITRDVTPKVKGNDYYTFHVGASRHTLIHQTICTASGDTNSARGTIGIGEEVAVYFDPPLNMTFPETPYWYVLGNGIINLDSGSSTLLTANLTPGSATVKVVVRDVTLSTSFSIVAPSGIVVVDHYDNADGWENGNNNIGADTKYLFNILPTSVSFKNVAFRENIPAHQIIWPDRSTNLWGAHFEYYGPSDDCVYVNTDNIGDGLYSKYKLFNGTSFVDFSYSLNWHDEYQNQNGDWIPYVNKASFTQFKGSNLTGQETYQGVSGGAIGPFQ